MKTVVVRNIPRAEPALVEALCEAGTATAPAARASRSRSLDAARRCQIVGAGSTAGSASTLPVTSSGCTYSGISGSAPERLSVVTPSPRIRPPSICGRASEMLMNASCT